MKVSRSSIYWKTKEGFKMRRYQKKEDAFYLEKINQIISIRPTYGYKRVTAMINTQRDKKTELKINRKRIYRIMLINGLIIQREKPQRDHQKTGKIITLHSNTRWCSDAFEVHCFDGSKVYVAFTIDSHDRECISYIAQKRPLLATDIQDLIINSVAYRFKKNKAPREIQFLSDRGSIYTAIETKAVARKYGLKSCFTAAGSPESNGMSEALVNTFKRDYVYTSDCTNAKKVLKLIPKWIKDYNEIAPHSGLKMMSPADYIKSKLNLAEGHEQEVSVQHA